MYEDDSAKFLPGTLGTVIEYDANNKNDNIAEIIGVSPLPTPYKVKRLNYKSEGDSGLLWLEPGDLIFDVDDQDDVW